ncbi:MAG: CBS domain-containing protein [Bacteroidales bacterium]|nr:CBS domain-containing protein [Bacteroidales bacterium]
MIAKQLVSEGIIPLSPADSATKALDWMDELKVSHIPVVVDGKYIGLISEKVILNESDIDFKIGSKSSVLQRQFVYDHHHILDVIRILSEFELSLIPVIDENDGYLGSVTSGNLLGNLARLSAINNPGAILILEIGQNDFVLSEISRIIEDNNAKMLCMFLTSLPNSTQLEVTLKINKMDIQPILQTLDRFNYNVKASFTEDKSYFEDLRDRYDSLMKYLNV